MSLPAHIRRRYAPQELRIRPRHMTTLGPYRVLLGDDATVAGPYSAREDARQAKRDLVAGRVVRAAD